MGDPIHDVRVGRGERGVVENAKSCGHHVFYFQNQFRLGIRFDVYPEKRWGNNTIAYKISSEYGKSCIPLKFICQSHMWDPFM